MLLMLTLSTSALVAGHRVGLNRLQAGLSREGHEKRDLVFMHVPFNFGHTVEKIAAFRRSFARPFMLAVFVASGAEAGNARWQAPWALVNMLKRPDGVVWGKMNPDLQRRNKVSGCSDFYTPQKYWDPFLADHYFGNKTVIGMLRDPYERLVAMFRGDLAGYGGGFGELRKTCDVNEGVKQAMQRYLASNDTFMDGCTYLPQAEYFDGPHGITIPVDNRRFPASLNQVFLEHGYPDMRIDPGEIEHVNGCNEKWAGDLAPDTRALVRQVYKRDFELLCEHFGYCDPEENTCLTGVPQMCPQHILAELRAKAA